ncbi:unnamed protein product [Adineta ricciae]|uniref:DZF domain-containing protein n=1 Tax=Adineta ricciae TaxID=249248 RepID=A0A814BZ62_ADIRI|nr:unnamed protein product [Adineta ricciae]CAF1171245.1 unnamed protein product [Adineta ricciae]
MTGNGMNYSIHNSMVYPQPARQQQQTANFYGRGYPSSFPQPTVSTYGAYPMYSSPYNHYDPIIPSTVETLAAFAHPNESSIVNNSQADLTSTKSLQLSTRRVGKDNVSRMYYCEACRIACGGYATYQAHLKGTKHRKKELSTQNQQTGVNILRCELCDITCTSSDAYKAHLEGNKHEKAMKLHRKLGKTIPSVEPQILNSSQPTNPSQSTLNGSQISSAPDQQITLSRLLENSNKPIGEEYIETTCDANNKPVLYHCKLCECTFNDIKGKDVHLKGKRHRLSYKKKVNPNFVVDNNSNNKLSSTKQKTANSNSILSNTLTVDQSNMQNAANTINQDELDDDTKYLMQLHKQIVPSPQLLQTIEQFVSTVESALKACSEQLHIMPSDASLSIAETATNQSILMGVSRIGVLGKSLIVNTDRLFDIVVICAQWPTRNLLQTVATVLLDNCDKKWKDQIQIDYQPNMETIELHTISTERILYLSISFTSLTVQQKPCEDQSDEFLSRTNCLNVLYSLHSTRWFQNQVSVRQHASALIRCLRYKSTATPRWQSLSSEALEILIYSSLSQCPSAINAFRRVLQYLSGGLILSNNCTLHVPWQTDSNKDVFEDLTNLQRNDITQEAQLGLRLLSFNQLTKWFEPPSGKRSYSEVDEYEIPTKRQCINSS